MAKETSPKQARHEPEMNTGDGMTIESTSLIGIASFKGHKITWPHKIDRNRNPCHYELRLLHRNRVILHVDALEATEFELTPADLYHIMEELRTYSLGGRLAESVDLDVCLRTHYEHSAPRGGCSMVTGKLILTFESRQRVGQMY